MDVLKRLQHGNIVRLHSVLGQAEEQDDDGHLLFLMEYAPGVELFEEIMNRKHFTESDARPIFAQLVAAARYLHELNIVHRDIKPENILLLGLGGGTDQRTDHPPTCPHVKLIDFGLSKIVGGGAMATTFVGTPQYYAPEVEITARLGQAAGGAGGAGVGATGGYGVAADCWSLGAVLYVMLSHSQYSVCGAKYVH